MKKTVKIPPTPGSKEAIELGCKCPVIDNHYGKATHCENSECVYPRKNAARSWVKAPKQFEWALKKGKTYSRDREDYLMLCASCHRKYDGSGNNTKKRYGIRIS